MQAPKDHEFWRDRTDATCALSRSDESGDTGVGSFRVAEVSELQQSGGQERFSILLEAHGPHELGQGIYDITFADDVAATLFLVPISPTALEAVVNRLVDVDEQTEVPA